MLEARKVKIGIVVRMQVGVGDFCIFYYVSIEKKVVERDFNLRSLVGWYRRNVTAG
jgi:hypothetical protein